MKPWPASIMGRTVAVLLLGLVLVAGIMAAQLFWERQTLLTGIGGWHVVTRITGVVKAVEETPAAGRPGVLRGVQGVGFRVTWSEDSVLQERHLRWQGRIIRDALETQLGPIARGDLRIGVGDLPSRPMMPDMESPGQVPGQGQGMGHMEGRMDRMRHPYSDFPRQAMIISLRLSDGTWLNFATPPAPHQSLWSSRMFWVGALGLVVVVVVSIWAVRRATQPLNLFARAAERLGRDFNAPPLAEAGPREVRRAAKAFNRMQRRLQAFVQNRTHMLAAISHDLRTPITRLKLRAEFVDDAEQREKMLADLDEMEAMIAATLQFARDDVMGEPAQALDLAQLVRDCAEDGGVTCLLPDSLPFTGRPVGLKRLVNNLLGNAKRYADTVEIELSVADDPTNGSDAGEVILSVRDDGPGIPEEMLARVFDPFVRVEGSRSRETGGVGLGLAAVKTIAQAHGGEVLLLNRESGGLEARVILPRAG